MITSKNNLAKRAKTAILLGILRGAGIGKHEVKKIFYAERESTGSVDRWYSGKASMNGASVKKLLEMYPNVEDIFKTYSELLDLLRLDTALSITKLERKFSHLLTKDGVGIVWHFPHLLWATKRPPVLISYLNQIDRLIMCFDIFGLTALVVLVHMATRKGRKNESDAYLESILFLIPSVNPEFDPVFQDCDHLVRPLIYQFCEDFGLNARTIDSFKHEISRYERGKSERNYLFDTANPLIIRDELKDHLIRNMPEGGHILANRLLHSMNETAEGFQKNWVKSSIRKYKKLKRLSNY